MKRNTFAKHINWLAKLGVNQQCNVAKCSARMRAAGDVHLLGLHSLHMTLAREGFSPMGMIPVFLLEC